MTKISYLSGPADFPSIFAFQSGRARQTFFGTNYMKLFIEFVKSKQLSAQVFTWVNTNVDFEDKSRQFILINRSMPRSGGWRYHLDVFRWNSKNVKEMAAFQPDVLLLTGAQENWWQYAPLMRSGAKVIASFHCVQWPVIKSPRLHQRIYAALNARLVLRRASAILVTSQAIRLQVESMLGPASNVPIIDHLPTYDEQQFESFTPPQLEVGSECGILFVGRIEADKGVFDLLQIAHELQSERPGQFRFHFCGEGTQLERLKSLVAERGLQGQVEIHGHCDRDELSVVIKRSHICVVPTRSEFAAGFEMTCAEAILAERPLITSRVCPAIDYLRAATVEVPPDDLGAYKSAILKLADDPVFYAEKRNACASQKGQFYDPANSWTAALERAWAIAGLDPEPRAP